MKAYLTKVNKLTGTDFREVHKKAFDYYRNIKGHTKRRPYIRSEYFQKDKVFLNLFWSHIFDKKNWKDRVRRLRYFPPGVELIKNTRFEPTSKENPNKKSEILHRFSGITSENDLFYAQVKEDKKTGNKYLMSVFPGK